MHAWLMADPIQRCLSVSGLITVCRVPRVGSAGAWSSGVHYVPAVCLSRRHWTLYDVFMLSYLLFICKASICQSLFSSSTRYPTVFIFFFKWVAFDMGCHSSSSFLFCMSRKRERKYFGEFRRWPRRETLYPRAVTAVISCIRNAGLGHGRVIRMPTAMAFDKYFSSYTGCPLPRQ